MIKYYVSKKQRLDGFHAVHKENCPFLDINSSIFLGVLKSSNDALWVARGLFWQSNNCIFCAKESQAFKIEKHFEWNMLSVS